MPINIIGGKYRGRKITVPKSNGLRPTSNRVRETLFNWLQMDIASLHTLDLFAGSGLLSFEAISRGASACTLIEKNKKTYQTLLKQQMYFKGESIRIINGDAIQFIKTHPLEQYGLIFIDPPFATDLLSKTLIALKDKLPANVLLYIECPDPIAHLPFQADCLKQKHAGQVCYSLYRSL